MDTAAHRSAASRRRSCWRGPRAARRATRAARTSRSRPAGAGVFDRISRELSGYYLLSFEPTDADRSSRDRRIKVEVTRRGLTVKARSTYALADAAAANGRAALPPEEQVKSLLASPLPTAGLPMRVATYSVTNAGRPTRARRACPPRSATPRPMPAEWPVGVLVFNSDDKVFVDSTALHDARAGDRAAPPSPRLLTMTMVARAGRVHAAAGGGRSRRRSPAACTTRSTRGFTTSPATPSAPPI